MDDENLPNGGRKIGVVTNVFKTMDMKIMRVTMIRMKVIVVIMLMVTKIMVMTTMVMIIMVMTFNCLLEVKYCLPIRDMEKHKTNETLVFNKYRSLWF